MARYLCRMSLFKYCVVLPCFSSFQSGCSSGVDANWQDSLELASRPTVSTAFLGGINIHALV
jgi:hypothetical protein